MPNVDVGRLENAGSNNIYRLPDGSYSIEGVHVTHPCGCKVIGVGNIPAPFDIQYCEKHAASPELLEALKNLMRETDEGTQLCAKEFAENARAVIAKAEGGAQWQPQSKNA